MKHLLNNMSEEEKNSIREQHTDRLKVVTENFSKLTNSKLGDSKPFVKNRINEGLLVTENPKSIANRINMEPTKSVTCYVKGDTIVFKFKNQEIGLDCTAPDSQ